MPLSVFAFGPLGQVIGPDKAVFIGGVLLLCWALVLIARPSWLKPIENPILPGAVTGVSAGGPPARVS
jgi:hypothetical protein